MTELRAACPNCGATIAFRWAQAVQTTCEYCQSVLVRHDLDLAKVGTSAIVPLTPSPIQLGTEGRWRDHRFTVVGRLVYRWVRGGWSEWHCRFDNDTSGWLSDAQADYVMSHQVTPDGALPRADRVQPDLVFEQGGEPFTLSSVTNASYVGSEGELPFTYAPSGDIPFADARSAIGNFATIDYSEDPPLLFVGEPVELRQLELRNLREFEGW